MSHPLTLGPLSPWAQPGLYRQKEAGADSICTWSPCPYIPCLLDLMEAGKQKTWKCGFTFTFFGRAAWTHLSNWVSNRLTTPYSQNFQIGHLRAYPEPLRLTMGDSLKKPTHSQLNLSSHSSWVPLCCLKYVVLWGWWLSILNTAVPHLSVNKPAMEETWQCLRCPNKGFPGGPVLKSSPCNAGDAGSIPGPGSSTCHRAAKPRHQYCWSLCP